MVVTVWSMALVIVEPQSIVFWTDEGYMLITERTGAVGLACSLFFLAYLCIDTAVGYACQHQFRRSMGPLYVHHIRASRRSRTSTSPFT